MPEDHPTATPFDAPSTLTIVLPPTLHFNVWHLPHAEHVKLNAFLVECLTRYLTEHGLLPPGQE